VKSRAKKAEATKQQKNSCLRAFGGVTLTAPRERKELSSQKEKKKKKKNIKSTR